MSRKSGKKSHTESATRIVQKAITEVYTDPQNWYEVMGDHMVIGVSGGLDSVVLAHALIANPPAPIQSIAIAHFDHGLRPDSRLDAEFVQGLADRWNVRCIQERSEVRDLGYGLEASARQYRYNFLIRAAYDFSPRETPATIALAHHMDDLAETVLMRVVRGAGLDGLSAMRAFTNAPFDRWVTVSRPLLRVRRETLQRYARENKLAWREDPTNQDLNHVRNYIRHIVIPALEGINPSVVEGIARTSRTLWIDRQRLERTWYINRDYMTELEFGVRVLLPLNKLELHPHYWPEWIGRIRGAIRAAFGAQNQVGVEHLEKLVRRLHGTHGVTGPHPLADNLYWSVVYYAPTKGEPVLALSIHGKGELAWMPYGPWMGKLQQRAMPQKVNVPGVTLFSNGWKLTTKIVPASKFNPKRLDPETGWVDADKVGDLVVTTARMGGKIAPVGMDGHTRALGDIFTDRKVLPALRSQWPVLIDEKSGEIVWLTWIAGSERTKVTPESKNAIHMRWKGPPRKHLEMRGEFFE